MIRDGLCKLLANKMFATGCDLEQACFEFGIESSYLSDAEIFYVNDLVTDYECDWP